MEQFSCGISPRRTFSLWKGKGRMGFDINKRRLLRFGFDVMKSWENFNSVCQKQSNGECPVVCYIHALTMPYSPWCQRMPRSVRRVRRILTYRRGAFGVARFDRQGNSQEPQIVKRATVYGLHVFFCVWTKRICYCGVCSPNRFLFFDGIQITVSKEQKYHLTWIRLSGWEVATLIGFKDCAEPYNLKAL